MTGSPSAVFDLSGDCRDAHDSARDPAGGS
jgi:hypothetical protein